MDDCSLYGDEIYLGWVHLKSLESKIVDQIIAERNNYGPYKDLFDFTERVHIGLEQLRIMIKAGSFRFTCKSKKELMWQQLVYVKGDLQPTSKPLFRERCRRKRSSWT